LKEVLRAPLVLASSRFILDQYLKPVAMSCCELILPDEDTQNKFLGFSR